ncbi:pyruvate kinase [Paenibacillus chitinolyticus]|uniref:pyruvate kinase n=1 Tax=Paenibacillus chitinolyticus TaxID=79263 RepID=UPI00366EDBD7
MRKTKIVCTIGPASESKENLKKLVTAGMNVMRLNFSHGDFEEHGGRIKNIRAACEELGGRNVSILLDTKGPEIRLGKLKEEPIELAAGEMITLTTEEVLGDRERVSVTYEGLAEDVKPGDTILIDDGLIGLTVEAVQGNDIKCRIVNSGPIKSKKGVNVPGVSISLPGITEKDANDIIFGIEQGIDFIAASFVRKASDVLEIRELLERHNASHIQIISKIENQEGVDNLDEILEVSDGLMVARGDLGVEIPPEDVPVVQKQMIKKCNLVGKPVITATMMLDSMQRNPRPTRAEASDVANAVFDGSDAVMLSGETAAGKYPVEAVETMSRIALRAEAALEYREIFLRQAHALQTTVTESISQSVANAALELDAKAIVTATESGYTARMVSKYRPKAPIVAVTRNPQVMRRLNLVWGVQPVLLHGDAQTTDELFEQAVDGSIREGYVDLGDIVVITAGVPIGSSGTTNLMKVHQVGEMIAKGTGIGTQHAKGVVVTAETAEEAVSKMKDGAILVTNTTDKDYMPAIERAAGLITDVGGITSHAAVVALSLGIPVIVGVDRALDLIKDDMEVTLFPEVGIVYSGRARVL